MACSVDAGKEQGGNLWEELLVRKGLPGLGVLGLQKEVGKGACLKLGGLDVLQQVPDDTLQDQKLSVTRLIMPKLCMTSTHHIVKQAGQKGCLMEPHARPEECSSCRLTWSSHPRHTHPQLTSSYSCD